MKIKNLTSTAIFVCLMFAGAKISIPFPPVPLTFQFMFCAMASLLLGAKYGTASQIIYILLGLIGLPVFSKGGGIGYIFEPTFGFILGFVFCALTIGLMTRSTKKLTLPRLILASTAGLVVLNIFGSAYFYLIFRLYLNQPKAILSILTLFAPYFIKDLIIGVFLATLTKTLIPILSKNGLITR